MSQTVPRLIRHREVWLPDDTFAQVEVLFRLEKAQTYPHTPLGMPGVETLLPVMLTPAKVDRCTVAQVSRWMSLNPAQCYGIPNKGKIEVGYDADVILVDLQNDYTVETKGLALRCGDR